MYKKSTWLHKNIRRKNLETNQFSQDWQEKPYRMIESSYRITRVVVLALQMNFFSFNPFLTHTHLSHGFFVYLLCVWRRSIYRSFTLIWYIHHVTKTIEWKNKIFHAINMNWYHNSTNIGSTITVPWNMVIFLSSKFVDNCVNHPT